MNQFEEEYALTMRYLDNLRTVYDDKGYPTGEIRDVSVIEIWKDIVEKMVYDFGDREKVYTVVSKDFQRFFSSFLQYSRILELMWTSNENSGVNKKRYTPLIRKIANQEFFRDYFHDGSKDFKELREWVAKNIKDRDLIRRVGSHLDCIVTGFFRQLRRRYGAA